MEWCQAMWDWQKGIINGGTGIDWSFLGLTLVDPNDDARDVLLAKLPSSLNGQVWEERLSISKVLHFSRFQMKVVIPRSSILIVLPAQEWWDRSPEAGPKVRAREPFGTPRPTMDVLCWQNSRLESLEKEKVLLLFVVCLFSLVRS